MVVSEDANRLVTKRALVHIAILLTIALGIGVYLISTTVLISKDSVRYIECAKDLSVEPAKAMHDALIPPGYPFLICITNKLAGIFYGKSSLEGWIISAQSVSVLCKIIATVVLYFLGVLLVGPRRSFFAVLILTILPIPTKYGSDALTEWPHVMFLATGFLLLLLGAKFSKWWMFGFVGIMASLGYLIREECCQLVIYGAGWLLFNLIRPQNKMSRAKAVVALILLLAGFSIIAMPYMRFKGYIFPEHPSMGRFPPFVSVMGSDIDTINVRGEYIAAAVPVEIAKGIWKVCNDICESLMYYFVLPLLLGIYYHFRKQVRSKEGFFITVFILLNIVMLLLFHRRGTFSRRFSLPLVALTIFYVPTGLQILADWFKSKFSKGRLVTNQVSQQWFFALLIIGVCICLPKLLRPIRIEKQGYRDAAEWLSQNTTLEDNIAVADRRLSFYAEREVLTYDEEVPERAKYVVSIVKDESEEPKLGRSAKEEYSVLVDKREKGGEKLVIYKMTR